MLTNDTDHRPERGFAAFLGVAAWVIGIFLILCFVATVVYFVSRGEPAA